MKKIRKIRILDLCPSVCPSVTMPQAGVLSRRQNMSSCKQSCMVAKDLGEIPMGSPPSGGGAPNTHGIGKFWKNFATFVIRLAISRKRYTIYTYFLLKLNRKSYVLYQTAILTTTSSDLTTKITISNFGYAFISLDRVSFVSIPNLLCRLIAASTGVRAPNVVCSGSPHFFKFQ